MKLINPLIMRLSTAVVIEPALVNSNRLKEVHKPASHKA